EQHRPVEDDAQGGLYVDAERHLEHEPLAVGRYPVLFDIGDDRGERRFEQCLRRSGLDRLIISLDIHCVQSSFEAEVIQRTAISGPDWLYPSAVRHVPYPPCL